MDRTVFHIDNRSSAIYLEAMISSTVRFLLYIWLAPQNLSPLKSSLLRASLACRRGALSHQSLSCMTWNTSGKAFSTITLWPSFATLGVMLEGIACNCGGCWTWGGWIRWRGSTASDTLSWGWPILGEYSIWYARVTQVQNIVLHMFITRGWCICWPARRLLHFFDEHIHAQHIPTPHYNPAMVLLCGGISSLDVKILSVRVWTISWWDVKRKQSNHKANRELHFLIR